MPKIAFAAAYTDEESNDKLKALGFDKTDFHMTTCFDTSAAIGEMPLYSFPKRTAVVKAVVEWPVGNDTYLVAELTDCEWSKDLNTLMKAYGAVEDLPHNPHITLIKGNAKYTSHEYQSLVGTVLTFNRHVVKVKDISKK
jgi:hypothetical protein